MDNKIKVNEEVKMSDTMHGAYELFKQVAGGQVVGEYTKDEEGNEEIAIMVIENGIGFVRIKVDKDKKVTFTQGE